MTAAHASSDQRQQETDYDAVVVGAGFSGLYALHRLRDDLGLSVKVIEKAPDVGGTWYWNQYPGAKCDSESHVYCYTFDEDILEEWSFGSRYPEQPEILEYLRFVTDRLDLREDITFETAVTGAGFADERGVWQVETDDGETLTSQFFVTAVGCLSEPYIPDFEDREAFEGFQTHTARWPQDGVDFDGKRVAVIGTGSTGIQVTPRIADRDVDHLTVFQRTANYAVPARDRELDAEDWAEIRENYEDIIDDAHGSGTGYPFDFARETAADLSEAEAREILERRWQEGGFRFNTTFEDLIINAETNEIVSEFIRDRIRERIDDPDLAAKLVPDDHYYGTKRPPLEEGYFDLFNRDDVTLVDVTETPIERFTPEGIRTTAGLHEFDVVVFATGFDAMTGALLEMDVRGRDGLPLADKWAEGPKTYLGVAVHGFPNMFTVTGPQSPSVLGNMPVTIEHSVEWITDAIGDVLAADATVIEATAAAEEAWTEHNNQVAEATLYNTVDSWYRNQNVPDQPTVFTPYAGGYHLYHEALAECADNDYEGFQLADPDSVGATGSPPQLSVMESD